MRAGGGSYFASRARTPGYVPYSVKPVGARPTELYNEVMTMAGKVIFDEEVAYDDNARANYEQTNAVIDSVLRPKRGKQAQICRIARIPPT